MTITTITAGGPGTYTVPTGVRWISVELVGCSGEDVLGSSHTGLGGRGGRLQVLVRVRPGEVLDYCVGRLGSTAATDLCRGGAPVANIGPRTGGRGGGGTYIARRSYGASTSTERLRGNMIAVAGGGGGGRNPDAPFGYTLPADRLAGGSSIAYDALAARYTRDGARRETEAWLKSFIEARGGVVSTHSPDSYDFATSDSPSSAGGRRAQHFNTVQPVLTNNFSGADSPYGGAGGGGGYQGGSAGGVATIEGEDWGYAGGAGTSWWDPYVSTVYYDSLTGGSSLTGHGGAKIVINDHGPSFSHVVQIGDIKSLYNYGPGDGSQGGDWGRAFVRLRSPIDGLPALDTGFYFIPTEGNRMVVPESSYVPEVTTDMRVAEYSGGAGYYGPPIGLSDATGESISFDEAYDASYRPGSSESEAWLGGDITKIFYTRAALFNGSVRVQPTFILHKIAGEAKNFRSYDFEINYTTTHPPRTTLTGPAAGAVAPIPDSSPAAAATFTATVHDPASHGAKSALYEDVITSYTLDLYEANQTTVVKSITTTPTTPIPVPRSGNPVPVSASPALTRSEWERVAFWRMRSKDKHGTESAPVAMRPIAMRARPTVQIVAPVSGDVIEGSKPSILINVTTPNGSGIFTTRYQILTSSFGSVYDATLNGLVASHTPANSVFAGVGSYIIRVTVTDLLGLSATTEIPVTSDYAAPPPVAYSIDDSRVEDDGYVEVQWQEAVAAEGFSRWNIYRREMPSSSWTLLSSIPNAGIRAYRDSTAVAGRIYMYSVTQVLVDRGGEIEGVVGVRHIPKTVPDLMNLASHTSPGYNSGDIPNGTLGFTSRAASNGSFGPSVVVNPDATPPVTIPGYSGKCMSHSHVNATLPTDAGGIFFSPYSHEFADDSTSNTGADGTSNFAVVEGASYTASLYVYNNTGAALGGYLAIEVYNSSGAVISSLTAKSVQRLAADPGWVRFSATTARLDSSAKFIGVTWVDSSGTSAPVNGEIFYAGLMVEKSESPLVNPSAYFNGAKPNDASYNYSWLGAPWVTQSLREQISMRDEDRTFLITNSNYWLLDPVNPARSIKLPNVKQYDYTEEYERLATNIIGRGRHVDFGDRLGRTGTLVMSIREPGPRSMKREDIFAFVASKTYFILKTPFGESFPVALGNPTWTQLAGVGSSDMGDLSLPFEEVY